MPTWVMRCIAPRTGAGITLVVVLAVFALLLGAAIFFLSS
jgi:hypothetical protein